MSLMYAQMGFSVASAFAQGMSAKAGYDMERVQRDYQDKMSAISAAQSRNALTTNEIAARDAAMSASQAIQVQSLVDASATEADAAAAGVTGGSVRSSMRGIMRSRLLAKKALSDKVQANARAFTQDRRNLALSEVMNKDVSVIPRPSVASSLLGLGASIIDIYDSHQPEGGKTTDTIAGWGL